MALETLVSLAPATIQTCAASAREAGTQGKVGEDGRKRTSLAMSMDRVRPPLRKGGTIGLRAERSPARIAGCRPMIPVKGGGGVIVSRMRRRTQGQTITQRTDIGGARKRATPSLPWEGRGSVTTGGVRECTSLIVRDATEDGL